MGNPLAADTGVKNPRAFSTAPGAGGASGAAQGLGSPSLDDRLRALIASSTVPQLRNLGVGLIWFLCGRDGIPFETGHCSPRPDPFEQMPLAPSAVRYRNARRFRNAFKRAHGDQWKEIWEALMPPRTEKGRRALVRKLYGSLTDEQLTDAVAAAFRRDDPTVRTSRAFEILTARAAQTIQKVLNPGRPKDEGRWQLVARLRIYFTRLTGQPQWPLIAEIVATCQGRPCDWRTLESGWQKRRADFFVPAYDEHDQIIDAGLVEAGVESQIDDYERRVDGVGVYAGIYASTQPPVAPPQVPANEAENPQTARSGGYRVRCPQCAFGRVVVSARLACDLANEHEASTDHGQVECAVLLRDGWV